MPLAHHGRVIPVVFQHSGDGRFVVCDHGLPLFQEGVADAGPSGVDAGQQPVAGRGAGPAGRMGVGEPQPFLGQLVDMRGADFRVWIVGAAIAIAQIVGQNQDDVGRGDRIRGPDGQGHRGQHRRRDNRRDRQDVEHKGVDLHKNHPRRGGAWSRFYFKVIPVRKPATNPNFVTP